MDFPDKFFVTGTDTGVGKTLVSAALCLGLDAHYWKPIQSGTVHRQAKPSGLSDLQWVQAHTELADCRFIPETFRLSEPLSPHAAAAIDGVRIELSSFRLPDMKTGERLVVEGAGGLMVPINSEHLIADLIERLGLPAIVVARSGLGTINHTVLTVQELKRRAIPVIGVVMNGEKNESNRSAIEHFAGVRVITQIEPMDAINPESLMQAYRRCFSSPMAGSLR